MSDFEFAFSLFGLLLGFTLVEVLSGLARSAKLIRTKHRKQAALVRLGWFTPMLALFVLLDVTSYWKDIWSVREHINAGIHFLFGGLFVAGAYYFAASMVFPDDSKDWPDLDEWFWSHRRQALVPLFVTNSIFMAYVVSIRTSQDEIAYEAFWQIFYFALLALAVISKRSMVVGGALAVLSALHLGFGLMSAVSSAG